MDAQRYRLSFPRTSSEGVAQDRVTFSVDDGDGPQEVRFHDYDEIYRRPGLYEQLFYDRLKCSSPTKVAAILAQTLRSTGGALPSLRVLDLGAGNGMLGEALLAHDGVARLVGVDIIPEAEEALYRDRPGLYDAYYTADMTDLSPDLRADLTSWRFNALACVAALGFGDIPTPAFLAGFNLVESPGWVAFNIKETFFDRRDTTGFSSALRELVFSEYMDLHHVERYQHRLSVDGDPLHYFAIVGRKTADVPEGFLTQLGLGS